MVKFMMNTRLVIVFVAVCLALAGCGSASGGKSADGAGGGTQMKDLVVAGGPQGGVWYAAEGTMTEFLKKDLPGTTVTAIEGGAIANIKQIEAGEVQVGFTWGTIFNDSLLGRNAFENKPQKKVAAIMNTSSDYQYVVVNANSKYKTLEDLKSSKFSAGEIGGAIEYATRSLFKAAGFSYDDIKKNGGNVVFEKYSNASQLMKDGRIDGFIISGDAKSGIVMDVEANMNVRIIPLEGPAIDKFIKDNKGEDRTMLPANSYKGQDKEVPVLQGLSVLTVSKELSEDAVYKITKSMYENRDKMVQAHPQYGFIKPENVVKGIPVENLHPGAVKYWKEIGILK